MKRVTGIGGIFLKVKDVPAMTAWYQKHLGIDFNGQPYFPFQWVNPHHPTAPGTTVFSFFKNESDYFEPSKKELMINFRVENLKGLLETLKEEGVQVVGDLQEYSYGKFGWIVDPEGNKIELWEPVDG
jgi:predicted enzyme related to lactoylglutathione lyase